MIQLEDLTKEFDVASGPTNMVVATDRLNLHIPAGEVFGLVGPNGAGKTTTLKMICGLAVPTSGRVTVNEIDVERHPEAAQRYIGYLADFFSLYDDLKVWEYLDYFAHAYKMNAAAIPARIDEVIARLGLESKRDSMIGGLSRGMKQRVGIARAVIHDPPVLILDEPTGGLDPKARVELKELLRELHRAGKTIFITSHILSDLEELCTSIGILEKGRLLRVGRLEDVMREGASTRQIRIRLASPGFASETSLESWLAAQPGVSAVVKTDAVAQFAYAGSDAELAELVRVLVAAGAPVCGVQEVAETLEQLYSRISTGEVM
jgi:ABC-2 type transport system ATP-binding protein